jgi:hypothetical protein
MGNKGSFLKSTLGMIASMLMALLCIVASSLTIADASGRVDQTCDWNAANHYASKGVTFMNAQDWIDAVYAFQAAFDSRAKCPPGSTDGVWGYWANVELAAAYYNLKNYNAALKELSGADTWFSAIDLARETDQKKKLYIAARQAADSIRENIAAAASRPAISPAMPSHSYGQPPTEGDPGLREPVGTVSVTRSSCDYFIVNAAGGYALLEWYGGLTPSEGDIVAGSFETYGFHTIYDKTADQSTRVWVEDYWLGSSDAFDQLNEKCQ